MVYNVFDYGATGDGSADDTSAIQKAIDVCHENGGGRVVLSGGHTYRSGTIVLHSYVDLHLEMGAVLKGSDNLEDYNYFSLKNTHSDGLSVPTYECCDYTGQPTLYFIYAKDCEYVSITGEGKIDGNEKIFYGTVTPWHIDGSFYPRVPLLFLEHIEHLTLDKITLTGSAFWTVHMIGCEDVLINNIRILNNLRLANCDSIDPDHCKNVRISNCHIECGDDGIVFKNTSHYMKYGNCENIVVTNCTIISTSAAVKFGSESEAPFRNILVQNCAISRSNRGISLMLRDDGCFENVSFSNISIDTRRFSPTHWWGSAEPVAITSVARTQDSHPGYIRDISFNNIFCTSENGILIYGDENSDIHDISFDNIKLNIIRRTDWPKDTHDLRPGLGENFYTGRLNGFLIKNASNIGINNFKMTVADEMKEFAGEEICRI